MNILEYRVQKKKRKPALQAVREVEETIEKATTSIGLIIESLHEGVDTKNFPDLEQHVVDAIGDLEEVLDELREDEDYVD